MDDVEPITVTILQARRMLGLGATKIHELLASGALRRVKVGRRTLITVASIHSLVENA